MPHPSVLLFWFLHKPNILIKLKPLLKINSASKGSSTFTQLCCFLISHVRFSHRRLYASFHTGDVGQRRVNEARWRSAFIWPVLPAGQWVWEEWNCQCVLWGGGIRPPWVNTSPPAQWREEGSFSLLFFSSFLISLIADGSISDPRDAITDRFCFTSSSKSSSTLSHHFDKSICGRGSSFLLTLQRRRRNFLCVPDGR